LTGQVVGVTDGDTITVLAAGNVQERIRLASIDAPEKKQPFGQVSKRSLSNLVYDRPVTIEWRKRDRYRRIVGQVFVGGRDVGMEQVRTGMAWHYRKYQGEQAPEDRERYAAAEDAAKAARRGLWRDTDPMPPWDWRHRP
jgi:endonuclease YncB( thermonuclease family)